MLHSRYCVCILCTALALSLAVVLMFTATPSASAAPPAKKGKISFINDVAPIFKENCFACHDAKKKKGKLDMTTFENLRKGGDNEDPIVPGKPGDSHMVLLLNTGDAKRMPPKEAGSRWPRRRSPSSSSGSRKGPSWTAASTRRPTWCAEVRVLAAAGPPERVQVPGHRQCPGLHAGQSEARREWSSGADCLGCQQPR